MRTKVETAEYPFLLTLLVWFAGESLLISMIGSAAAALPSTNFLTSFWPRQLSPQGCE
jgi:hypothetical protein